MSFSKRVIICFFFCAISFVALSQNQHAEKVVSDNFDNLYKIDDSMYRCEQPNSRGMKELEKMGVLSILNLRNRTNDKRKARNVNLNLHRVAINAWRMNYDDIVTSLKIIQQSKKPIVVHCLHGADRTGVIIAAYRMVFQNWTKQEAIDEFLDPKFGFHIKWFKNLHELLTNLDIQKLKSDLML